MNSFMHMTCCFSHKNAWVVLCINLGLKIHGTKYHSLPVPVKSFTIVFGVFVSFLNHLYMHTRLVESLQHFYHVKAVYLSLYTKFSADFVVLDCRMSKNCLLHQITTKSISWQVYTFRPAWLKIYKINHKHVYKHPLKKVLNCKNCANFLMKSHTLFTDVHVVCKVFQNDYTDKINDYYLD